MCSNKSMQIDRKQTEQHTRHVIYEFLLCMPWYMTSNGTNDGGFVISFGSRSFIVDFIRFVQFKNNWTITTVAELTIDVQIQAICRLNSESRSQSLHWWVIWFITIVGPIAFKCAFRWTIKTVLFLAEMNEKQRIDGHISLSRQTMLCVHNTVSNYSFSFLFGLKKGVHGSMWTRSKRELPSFRPLRTERERGNAKKREMSPNH